MIGTEAELIVGEGSGEKKYKAVQQLRTIYIQEWFCSEEGNVLIIFTCQWQRTGRDGEVEDANLEE